MKIFFKTVLVPSILIFIISFFIHSAYNMIPNFITSILFPINESIWEHMKLIYTSYIIYLIFIKLFFKDGESIFLIFITSIINIVLFLIIFMPVYLIFGENLIVTLILFFISINLSNMVKIWLSKKLKITKKIDLLSIFGIIFIYIIFAYLTYYPFDLDIFKSK